MSADYSGTTINTITTATCGCDRASADRNRTAGSMIAKVSAAADACGFIAGSSVNRAAADGDVAARVCKSGTDASGSFSAACCGDDAALYLNVAAV